MIDHILEFKNVYQKYPDKSGNLRTILNNINLKISRGELITIVGPTGCGKSTLLRLILGSEKPYQGQVLINGTEIQAPSRNRGVVFQHYSLYPNRTVKQNVMFGLEMEKFSLLDPLFKSKECRKKRMEFTQKADQYLEQVGLLEHADKYPHQLSGGMRQRAAIAQAMVMEPEVLMMDEPHGALDVGTREEMQIFILDQWKREHQTIFFVTHDLEEAIFLGSRILVLSPFYSGNQGEPSDGSKIVKDIPISWPLPRPTDIKHSKEFNDIMKDIRHEGLDPEYLQHIEYFDLRHEDATWWETLKKQA
ncbi:ABC transporter ATP-binding protein [bacterium]